MYQRHGLRIAYEPPTAMSGVNSNLECHRSDMQSHESQPNNIQTQYFELHFVFRLGLGLNRLSGLV